MNQKALILWFLDVSLQNDYINALLKRWVTRKHNLNICVIMEKNHNGQAPTLSVLIWEMSQSWPFHTILKSPWFKRFGQTNLLKCLKNALLKISINFRMDFVGVLSSSLGAHAIELNICHTTTDFLRLACSLQRDFFLHWQCMLHQKRS